MKLLKIPANPYDGLWVFLDSEQAKIRQLQADVYAQAIQAVKELNEEVKT